MWYVIQVYTGQEERIALQCREKAIEEREEVFIPLVERMTKVRGEWVPVKTRLFPGYVFVETDNPQALYIRLKEIKSMTKLLKTGEEITPLYSEEEEYLKRLQDEDHVVRYSEGWLEGDAALGADLLTGLGTDKTVTLPTGAVQLTAVRLWAKEGTLRCSLTARVAQGDPRASDLEGWGEEKLKAALEPGWDCWGLRRQLAALEPRAWEEWQGADISALNVEVTGRLVGDREGG